MSYTLGLVSVSFRGVSPRDILKAMQSTPLTQIEWGSDVHVPPEKAAEIAALQAEFGVRCSSYGTYFCIGSTPMRELQPYIDAARTLGTDILRLWCGGKDSEEYTEAESEALFAQCRLAAELAEKNRVKLCMECHGHSYTNEKLAAYRLMTAVDSPWFRMYWQPNHYRSFSENVEYARILSPYTEHLHVFHWEREHKYPLREAVGMWQQYLRCFPGNKTLLLEFMPDDQIESLPAEAQALSEIAGEFK